LPSQEDDTGYKLLPQIELALASWTLKDLWESLVHDSLDVNYETRPLLPSSPIPRAQEWPGTSAPHSGKSAHEALIPTNKRFSLFALSRFPSK